MAIGAGLTSAITNPLHGEVVQAIMGADVVNGQDKDCMRWIKRYREPLPAGEHAPSRLRRRRRAGQR